MISQPFLKGVSDVIGELIKLGRLFDGFI